MVVAEGIEGLLSLFVRAFIECDDEAVTSLGAFASFDYYVRGCGGQLIRPPYLASATVDLDALLAAACRHRAKLLYLANPDNPTGRQALPTDIRHILHHLPEGCMLLLDEAYVDYVPTDEVLSCSEIPPNLVRLRSFSKGYGLAGARIGYAVADPAVVARLDAIRQHFAVSKLSQEMALAAFGDHGFFADVLAKTAEGREHYRRIAELIGVPTLPGSTNFVTFDFGTVIRAKAVGDILEENDVFVSRPVQPPLNRLIRITIGPPDARAYLSEVLHRAVAKL
jgi:histidinol-phosphate aminotransferase